MSMRFAGFAGLVLFAIHEGAAYELPLSRRAVCATAAVAATRWARPATADETPLQAAAEVTPLAAAEAPSAADPAPVAATEEPAQLEVTPSPAPPAGPSAFDFDVPFRGEPRDSKPFLGQKASVFINVKFDDPISIDQMPAIAELADKYASKGVNVLAFPTDQGWFEADDSDSLRLKFKQIFGFGRYPTSVVFDKADLLGDNAQPLFAWLTKAFPNPWGVERVVFNYEKWLMDANGRPLRRYPRKFPVNFMEADVSDPAPPALKPRPPSRLAHSKAPLALTRRASSSGDRLSHCMSHARVQLQAVIDGKPLPPPSERYLQAWEDAKREATKSEYVFRPGLNYYKKGSPAS